MGSIREKLIEQINYEEIMRDDEEIVNFIPAGLLYDYWRLFGGIFLQRENKREKIVEITYSNNHYTHRANIDITSMAIDNIIKIMKCGLETGIDLFVSPLQKAEPIMWRADVEKQSSNIEIEAKEKATETM